MSNFREYVEAGWALCKFNPGTKGPEGPGAVGWNTRERAITDPQHVNGMLQGGLLHAFSNTCSVDIDNLTEARAFMAARGIDLDAMLNAPDAVQIVSGRPNRAKLLYRLTTPLASRKLAPYQDLVGRVYHAVELRCATRSGKSVQDVIPPSVHPDTGKPYQWKFNNELLGSWKALPELPQALLALWQDGQHEAPALLDTGEAQAPGDVNLDELRFYLDYHTSDAYDDWVAVGMALHDATGGSPEGLLLWDEWSRQFPSYGASKDGSPPQYPTDKWRSFTAGHGFTIGYLRSKAPAYVPPDAFPVVQEDEFKAPAPSGLPPGPGEDTRPGAHIRKVLSQLVYITSQQRYYDMRERCFFDDKGVNAMYMAQMPLMPTGANGAMRRAKPSEILETTAWTRDGGWRENAHAMSLHPGAGRFFEEGGRRYLNTYQDPQIEPLAPTPSELAAFNFMWTRPDEKVFRDWLMKFFAHAVQKPGVKIRSAPLVVGHVTGSGKSTLMRVLPELLFTPRYVTTMTSESLREHFNDNLAKAWWVHFEEMHSGNSKGDRVSIFNKIKPWVSENTMSVRPMYGSRYDAPNRVQFTGASNYEDDALHVDDQDRRWCVGHIETKMSERESSDLYAFLESERAPGVLRHVFLNQPLDGFNPNAPTPSTAAKRVMVRVNYGTWETELLDMMSGNCEPFNKDLFTIKDVLPYVKRLGATTQRLARLLHRAPFSCVKMPSAYGVQLWAWRNKEAWLAAGPGYRNDYFLGTCGRPPGYAWSDELPAPLAEACGLDPPPEPLL